MAWRIPDLWRLREDAARLYQLYFCRLWLNRMHSRVVEACRQIRRYAARGPGAKAGLFTFSYEIESLCELKQYSKAWRRLRLREEIVHGKRFDLRRRQWTTNDAHELAFSYAPVLYFLGRFRLGCFLMETSLGVWFREKKKVSYEIANHVLNGTKKPWHRCGVTLSHFYARLGKDLRAWRDWEAFVHGFHPKLFRLGGVRRDELLEDPDKLEGFLDRLNQIQAQRTTCGVWGGQRDLIENVTQVKRRQKATQKQLDESKEQIKPTRERMDVKLRELFPELQGLPR